MKSSPLYYINEQADYLAEKQQELYESFFDKEGHPELTNDETLILLTDIKMWAERNIKDLDCER